MIRLQKHLADQGIASRRKCEEFIAKGMVKVNGEVIKEMGVKIDPGTDKVEIDGKRLQKEQAKFVYYALHKPVGFVSSCVRTATEKDLVIDLVPAMPRVFPIGRLDKDSEGLIILSNDGQLTLDLTHPSREHEKEYLVEVNPAITDAALDKLRAGVKILDGEQTQPCEITRRDKRSFNIILKEGKNRQIRRMVRKVGCSVMKLKRIRIGGFFLNDFEIPPGKYKSLSTDEVALLKGKPSFGRIRISKNLEQ